MNSVNTIVSEFNTSKYAKYPQFWALGDTISQILVAQNVYEIDIVQALPTLLKLHSSFRKKYASLLEKIDKLPKQQRNIQLGKSLTSEDIQYLGFLCQATIITYLKLVLGEENFTLLEIKKDGVVISTDYIDFTKTHPIDDNISVSIEYFELYIRYRRTSFMFNDTLTVKGYYKNIPFGLRDTVVHVYQKPYDIREYCVKVHEIYTHDIATDYFHNEKQLFDAWFSFAGKTLDKRGNLSTEQLYAPAYLIWIFNPIVSHIARSQ